MEKEYRILYEIHKNGYHSQRQIAQDAEISLGLVNSLLKKLTDQGYLQREPQGFGLTLEGLSLVEARLRGFQNQKLSLEQGIGQVKAAVILAAGDCREFDCPVAMLPVRKIPVIDYLLQSLQECGIDRFLVVTGYGQRLITEHLGRKGLDISFVENTRYEWTGTMASLALAKDWASEEFLLVESNQIFEPRAAQALAEADGSGVLLVNPSGSMDEAYVELDDEGNIFRISKDIRQMNRVDGEMVGISRISPKLFEKMLKYYEKNENPLLNYEYVLESIGRVYRIPGVRIDDLKWTVIENRELYRRAEGIVYPGIVKKKKLQKENRALEVFMSCTGIPQGQIEKVRVCGGMTNTNFYVKAREREYVLRIPGAGTDGMIDRRSEEKHAALAAEMGINVPTYYFDARRGIKITPYITGAQTLNGKTARWEENIRKTAALLRRLHGSEMPMERMFSVEEEYAAYKRQAWDAGGKFYKGFEEMDQWFAYLMVRLNSLGREHLPCHNDLVAENLIRDAKGRMYLIDWEYAGYNDPMWDLASHLLECEFNSREEKLFLECYFGGEAPRASREKILIFKMCQDILWSIWTVIKEAKGEDFGTYGQDRMQRAKKMKEEYRKNYEKK